MPVGAGQNPTVRRRRLGLELRRLRDGLDLKIEDVVNPLGWSTSKLSRIETGRIGIRVADLERLLDLYGMRAEPMRSELVALARQTRQRGWWQAYGDTLGHAYQTIIALEGEASAIHTYEALAVPGLLQTPAYARALIAAAGTDRHLNPDQVDTLVAARMARQSRLSRDAPPRLIAVIDEAGLRRQVGNADVMRNQFRYLAEMNRMPTVAVHVLPFAAGAHTGMDGAFTIFEFEQDPHIVHTEGKTGAVVLDRIEDLDTYKQAFRALLDVALDAEESVEFLAKLGNEM